MVDVAAEAKKRLKERTEKKRFRVPEGETSFRVLPNAKGVEKNPWVEYRMHSDVGPNKRYMRCGKNIKGEGDCFLCDKILPRLEGSSKTSAKQRASRMTPKDVFAVQVAVFDAETESWTGPKLWECPATVANSLLGFFGSRKRVYWDPKKGYNITVNRIGTGRNDTKYTNIEADEDSSKVPDELIKRLKPFSEVVRRYDESEMKASYYGHEQEEEEEETIPSETEEETEEPEEEEETPKKKKKSKDEDEDEPEEEEETEEDEPKKKKKSKDEDDEPEEDTDSDGDIDELLGDEPEEEEETPKKKKKSKDEDEDEPEEEEETPKKKAKKKSRDEDDD